MDTAERRRHHRVKLREPLRGAVGNARIYVLDGSPGGLRVVHQSPFPPPGAVCRIELPTEVGAIKVDCEVVRTVAQPAPLTRTDKPIFHSGLAVVAAADRQSEERLKTIFETAPGESGDAH